jgi:hypothetical protein
MPKTRERINSPAVFDLLREAREGVERADRAMAHIVSAALLHGAQWRDVLDVTGLTREQAEECMARWSEKPEPRYGRR